MAAVRKLFAVNNIISRYEDIYAQPDPPIIQFVIFLRGCLKSQLFTSVAPHASQDLKCRIQEKKN